MVVLEKPGIPVPRGIGTTLRMNNGAAGTPECECPLFSEYRVRVEELVREPQGANSNENSCNEGEDETVSEIAAIKQRERARDDAETHEHRLPWAKQKAPHEMLAHGLARHCERNGRFFDVR